MSLLLPSVEAVPEPRCRRRLVLAAVAIAGVLAGAVGAAVLVTAAFLSAAEDIGRGMSEGLGSVRVSLAERPAADDAADGTRAAGGPVQQFPAVAPGALGSDRVLDGYAQSCFGGDLAACDDLWAASPPLSTYEEYAATCAGRVKRDAVPACADLG
jgi:hypothetical protein